MMPGDAVLKPVGFTPYRLLALMLLLWSGSVPAIDPADELKDPGQQALYARLTQEVRCLVCQNQPIADSTAPLAADLRREIRRKIEAGADETEIKDFLVSRYGDFVLYRPRFQSWGMALWLGPVALLLIGLAAWLRVASKRIDLPMDRDAP